MLVDHNWLELNFLALVVMKGNDGFIVVKPFFPLMEHLRSLNETNCHEYGGKEITMQLLARWQEATSQIEKGKRYIKKMDSYALWIDLKHIFHYRRETKHGRKGKN